MLFKKLQATKYPPRLWGLVGYPGSGKSTFATAMRAPILAIVRSPSRENLFWLMWAIKGK
jgi:putative protein kinase ArgK-like GTPase of G3E family